MTRSEIHESFEFFPKSLERTRSESPGFRLSCDLTPLLFMPQFWYKIRRSMKAKAQETEAREAYREETGDEWTTPEAARAWLIENDYPVPAIR